MTRSAVLIACAFLAGCSESHAATHDPMERELLVYLSRSNEGRNGQAFVPGEPVGFARFCDFAPESRQFFEGLAYVRVTQETYARLVEQFQRECGVRLRREGERAWTVIRRPQPGERLPRRLTGEGVRVTVVDAGASR